MCISVRELCVYVCLCYGASVRVPLCLCLSIFALTALLFLRICADKR